MSVWLSPAKSITFWISFASPANSLPYIITGRNKSMNIGMVITASLQQKYKLTEYDCYYVEPAATEPCVVILVWEFKHEN